VGVYPYSSCRVSKSRFLTPDLQTTLPGHSTDRFSLYDISGRRVGVYKGERIGEGLRAGVCFLRPEGGDAKPLRIVKVR